MISPVTYRRLARAREFILAAHASGIGLGEMAREANLSPYHFQRMYRLAFHETPHDYLRRVRLARAKTLLRGGLSVSETCLEVGFESLSSFSGLFVREVGLPPSLYRRYARSAVVIPGVYRTVFVPACFLSHPGGPDA